MNDPGAASAAGAAGAASAVGAAGPDRQAEAAGADGSAQAQASMPAGPASVDAPSVGVAAAEAELLGAAQVAAVEAASATSASVAAEGTVDGAGAGEAGVGGADGAGRAGADGPLAGIPQSRSGIKRPITHTHDHQHAKHPHNHNHNHKHQHEHTHEPGHEREHEHGHEDHSALASITNAISANFRRAIVATVAACAGLALTYASGGVLPTDNAPIRYFNSNAHRGLGVACACLGAGIFLIFGVTAVRSATKEILKTVPDTFGDHRKNGLRWFCLLVGYLLIILGTLGALDVPVERLLVGGAVTGVILGIAAQQSLGNLFAGLMLLLTRPFEIGDEVSLRSGPLGGVLTGLVADMNLTYVKLVTEHGTILLPNSSIVSASIGPPGAFG